MGTRRYCLFCFATLPEESSRCAACQKVTRSLDYREHWNRNPRILSIEQTIKTLTVVVTGLVMLLFFAGVGSAATGPGAGWFFLLPLMPAVGLWKTASALTRVQPYFQPKVFWLAVFVLLGLLLVFVDWVLVTIPLAGVFVVLLVARHLRRWKRELIAGR